MNSVVRIRRRAISTATRVGSITPNGSPEKTAMCPESLSRKLTGLGATGGSVWNILNEYVSEGNIVQKYELWSSAIQLRRFGKFRQALQIMEWMEMKKIEYSHSDHSVRLDLIHKAKGIAAAEKYMNDLSPESKNKFTLGALLNCHCMDSQEQKALQVFEEMTDLGFVTSALPFGNLMTLYTKLGKHEKIPSLAEEMKRRNIDMSTYTYNLLMQSYAAMDDVAQVKRVLSEIESSGSKTLDWTTYSNAATIYVKAGLFEKARVSLQKMEEKMRSRTTREAFHYLISLYGGIGETGEVFRVWELLKSGFPTLTNVSYLVMLQALARVNDIEGLKKCFEEWRSGNFNYDTRLLNTVVGAYLRNDMCDEAVLLFEEAKKKTKGPFFNTRERFIWFFLENEQVDLALSYLDANVSHTKEYKWLSPESGLVGKLLSYFEKAKDVNGAERVLDVLKPVYRPKLEDYRSLMKVYVAAGEFSPEMRLRLDGEGVEIGPELEELLLRVCPH